MSCKEGSYREEAHEIQAEEEVDVLNEAVEANGDWRAVGSCSVSAGELHSGDAIHIRHTHLERACPFETYAGGDFWDDMVAVVVGERERSDGSDGN